VPIRALVPLIQDIPAGLEAIILKCLSKRPEHRYQSMRELSGELLRVQRGIVPKALPELRATGTDFNLPPDYYQADVAANVTRPSPRARWSLYAALTLAVGLGAAAIAFAGSRPNAQPVAPVVSASQPRPSPPAPDSAPSASGTRSGAPEARWVVLELKPADAHAIIDDKDMGASPVTIGVPEATTVSVVVQRADYVPVTVTLDGSQNKKTVELKKVPHVARPTQHATSRNTGKQIGGDDIANPWEHKPKTR
jgi:serine/threonine-protein kinase